MAEERLLAVRAWSSMLASSGFRVLQLLDKGLLSHLAFLQPLDNRNIVLAPRYQSNSKDKYGILL